jgi:hypothetical protein
MVDSLSVRGLEREACIPGAAAGVIETSAVGAGMAKRRHYDRGHRASDEPFVPGDGVQNAQLRTDPIIRPSLEHEDSLEVFRRSDGLEDSYRRIAAGDQPAGCASNETGERRFQFHAPRRASSKRLTR